MYQKELQSQKIQYIKKKMNKISNLTCSEHTEEQIEYIHTNSNSQQILKCCQCVLEQNLRINELVLIEHIITSFSSEQVHNEENDEDHQFIQNWPPGINQNILNVIKQDLKSNNISKIRQEVLNYFESLEKEINEYIVSMKKSALIDVDRFSENGFFIKKVYDQISKKSKLKEIFENHNEDKEKLNSSLSQLIQKINGNSDENYQIISKLYKEDIEMNPEFDISQPLINKQLILELIQNLQFFSLSQFQSQQQNKIQEKEMLKRNEKIDNFYKTSSIVHYLNGIQKQFRKNQIECKKLFITTNQQSNLILNSLYNLETKLVHDNQQEKCEEIANIIHNDFNDILKIQKNEFTKLNSFVQKVNDNQEKVLDTSELMISLSEQQNLNIQDLVKKYLNQSDQTENDDLSKFVLNLILKDPLFSSQNKTIITEQIVKFPIFKNNNLKPFIPINITFSLSQFCIGGRVFNNKDNSITLKQDGNQSLFFSDQLNYEKKYIIRFRFSYPFNQMNIQIGLRVITKDSKFKVGHYIGQPDKNVSMVKNNKLSSEQLTVNEIEMRVCLKEKILVFTDYPNYQHFQYEQEDQLNFNCDEIFSLKVQFCDYCSKKMEVTITGFFEVGEIPLF